jgi:hypothetical protein
MEEPNVIDASVSAKTDYDFPQSYGDNKAVLMVRDPWTFYAYWEIKKEVEDSVRTEIQKKGLSVSKSVLRVYDITETGADRPEKIVFDFELKGWTSSWYVHVTDPGREWMADIGILCSDGEFFLLARSNAVRTPSNRMSDVYDENWMCSEDFYRIFETDLTGKSSLELRESIERYLRKWLFSGGVSSGASGGAGSLSDRG